MIHHQSHLAQTGFQGEDTVLGDNLDGTCKSCGGNGKKRDKLTIPQILYQIDDFF
jgi:hypothetical protein